MWYHKRAHTVELMNHFYIDHLLQNKHYNIKIMSNSKNEQMRNMKTRNILKNIYYKVKEDIFDMITCKFLKKTKKQYLLWCRYFVMN